MADGDGLPPHRRKKNNVVKSNTDDDSESRGKIVELDLGDDNLRKADTYRLGNQNSGPGPNSSDGARREDNPFSFKHFLRCDSNHQNKGARPKVYFDGRPVSSVLDTQQGQIISENPSVLPDFVQDHLVIEQCYLPSGPNFNFNVGAQLPDFTQNSPSNRQNVNASDENLTNGDDLQGSARPQEEFPLDLPLTSNTGRIGAVNEVAVSKSLPDFLNDGAVRSQTADNISGGQSPEADPDRQQRELGILRRELIEQTNRAEVLKRELDGVRNQDNEYTQNLIKALEQVEDNLERSNRRAASAESTILKLRQEINMLKKENNALRMENATWGGTEGAAGGPRHYTPPNHNQRLAQELRNAASTAEVSLRQLLSGVDNLRMMASTLENMHRIEERNEPFLNSDENTGPAL